MSDIKVMGHTPVDTDSVCSPMVYAMYLSKFQNKSAIAVIGSELPKEAKYVLDYLKLQTPTIVEKIDAADEVVLIDSTNPQEFIPGVVDAEIIEVIDHHKLGGLATSKPLRVTIRPYGCVATVIAEIMGKDFEKMDKSMAGLMLAGIMSDTLNLTSPTTTDQDRAVVAKLVEISGIDKDAFATGMFDAKSDISDLTAEQVITTDTKVFDFGGKNYRVSVIETTQPKFALDRLAELRATASELMNKDNLAGVLVFIVDIINSNATLFCTAGSEELCSKAFSKDWENGLMQLPGVVSRKKQIVPELEKAA